MTVATKVLTVRLPVQAVNRLRRVAALAHRPIDEVVAESLQSTLPPLLDELPAAFQPLLAQLENWSSEALRRQMYATVDDDTLDRYDELLAQNVADSLSAEERQELDTLRRQNELLMYQKAYAALLLKWRDEYVPTLSELETGA